jgi:hypothetical protein
LSAARCGLSASVSFEQILAGAAGEVSAGAAKAEEVLAATGERLLDGKMLNTVLVLMLVTSILAPVLTERFTPRMLAKDSRVDATTGRI